VTTPEREGGTRVAAGGPLFVGLRSAHLLDRRAGAGPPGRGRARRRRRRRGCRRPRARGAVGPPAPAEARRRASRAAPPPSR